MLQHRFHSPFAVARQLLAGKSLTRTLFNLALKGQRLHGDVLDLGSKSTRASYYQYLDQSADVKVTCTDLVAAEGVVELNVEREFGLASDSYDVALAFHLFEHVFHFQRAPSEVFRVLRPGGRVMVSVPFLHEYHADPDDYVRLTDSGLRRTWEEAGFRVVHMEAVGEGLLTATFTRLPGQMLPAFLRPLASTLLYLLATPFDRLLALRPRISGRTLPQRFALEYFGIFEKPR